jgi:adenylate cyclase
MRNPLKRWDVALTLLFFLFTIPAERYEIFSLLEDQTISFRHILRASLGDPELTQLRDEIMIVALDEDLYTEYGSFPFRRTDLGKIAEILSGFGAKVVALDFLMDFGSSYGEDEPTAEMFKNADNVLLVSYASFVDGKFDRLAYPTEVLGNGSRTGYSNLPPTSAVIDNLARLRIYPEITMAEEGWPFAIQALSIYWGVTPKLANNVLSLGDEVVVELDQFSDIYIDFPALDPDTRYLSEGQAGFSALEILDLQDVDPDEQEEWEAVFGDKIVLVGDTWEVTHDKFNTPMGPVYGVEIIADTISTLMNGVPLRPASLPVETGVTFVFLFLLLATGLLKSLGARLLAATMVYGFYMSAVSTAYIYQGLVISMSYGMLAGFFCIIVMSLRQYALAEQSQRVSAADPELFEGSLFIGDDLEIGLDQFSELYIDYPLLPLGEEGVARLHEIIGIPASEILFAEDEEELEELAFLVEDKIVLIGEVAEVAHDEFETPVGNVYGVNIIANSISTILREGPLQAAPIWMEILAAVVLLVVFLTTRVMQAPLKRNLISIGAILVFVFVAVMTYVSAGLILSMSYVLLASVITIGMINARFYLSEMGQKALIRDAFGQYLSPKVVTDLVKDPEKLTLGGEEREMTAYFSDIASFSSFSEKLTPTELVNVLNDYLTEMCNIIIGLEGTVDKFEGDSIVAFWGAPAIQKDHAKLACFASIDMNKALIPLRDKWVAEGRPSISVRMGLNSGPMVVGNMGSAQRMNYTIMGDVVNLASRLEGANKAYNSGVMISEATYGACQADIDVRELDTIRVVGKSESVKVYQLLERKNQTENSIADLVEKFERALDLYKDGNYKDALSGFESCIQFSPEDGPSLVYVNRCRDFIATLPAADWDGVFSLDSKG